MRLWSIHPRYLDSKGLVALWREGLLALHVLRGKTKGYKNHPQLIRFREAPSPVATIGAYLHAVVDEADARGYNFDRKKLPRRVPVKPLSVTSGQLNYEWEHLQRKLYQRDRAQHAKNKGETPPMPHPLLQVKLGPVADWERT